MREILQSLQERKANMDEGKDPNKTSIDEIAGAAYQLKNMMAGMKDIMKRDQNAGDALLKDLYQVVSSVSAATYEVYVKPGVSKKEIANWKKFIRSTSQQVRTLANKIQKAMPTLEEGKKIREILDAPNKQEIDVESKQDNMDEKLEKFDKKLGLPRDSSGKPTPKKAKPVNVDIGEAKKIVKRILTRPENFIKIPQAKLTGLPDSDMLFVKKPDTGILFKIEIEKVQGELAISFSSENARPIKFAFPTNLGRFATIFDFVAAIISKYAVKNMPSPKVFQRQEMQAFISMHKA